MKLSSKIATGGAATLVIASASMLGMTSRWEGRSYPVYLDIGGVPTVCEGHTGPEVRMGERWTKDQCDAILIKNATKYGQAILKCVDVPLNQNQFDALTLFAFNVGIGGACSSRAVREINRGNYAIGCQAIATGADGKPAWSFVKGKYVQGLQNRRLYERDLCLKPIEPVTPLPTDPNMPAMPVISAGR